MVSVVGEMFCNPYTTELVVRRRRESLKRERYDVFDLSDNLIFTVDGGIWNIRRKRVLRDATGIPLLSMRTKGLVTMRYKWEVYKGESTESEDLLFSAREPNLLSFKPSLDVTLPPPQNSTDISSIEPDFQTFGRYIGSSFKLFEPIHNTLLAEVVHDFSWGGLIKGNYSFKVRVNPYVDFAFVVALLVITDDTSNLR
ncbi:Tubby-like C-terminal [Arabidopsis thaliana x Arabidopsis arenosa]|uniref:Tubby-like C-terminal n=1 Tax=Arabidopsis thaliana x Arabidopsis arenosa TaxID=1240361 RepID=A0A8T2AS42_9BRAS|nr:Tubby-like C-terminal [Arabidopsis thaliana x Arabidopsis arenosa]